MRKYYFICRRKNKLKIGHNYMQNLYTWFVLVIAKMDRSQHTALTNLFMFMQMLKPDNSTYDA